MGEPNSTKDEEKSAIHYGRLSLWALAVVIFYVLSAGPVTLLMDKGVIKGKTLNVIERIYSPMGWAYESTFLHKPLGMYLHLWDSALFDEDGDMTHAPK